MLGLEEYLDRWAGLHGGYNPRNNRLVHGWLQWVYAAARPLARLRVPPAALTAAGVLVSGGAAGLATASLSLGAALAVVLSGLFDSLDGAVATLTGRATRWGYVLDSAADRASDSGYLLVLWLLGAPAGPCVAGGGLMFLQEYVRARAGAAGMAEIGVVTVWERPTRVAVTAAFAAGAAVSGEIWPRMGAWTWVGLGLVGLAQLAVVVRRRLS